MLVRNHAKFERPAACANLYGYSVPLEELATLASVCDSSVLFLPKSLRFPLVGASTSLHLHMPGRKFLIPMLVAVLDCRIITFDSLFVASLTHANHCHFISLLGSEQQADFGRGTTLMEDQDDIDNCLSVQL